MFSLEYSLTVNYFAKKSVAGFNEYERNMYYVGLGIIRETKINPSSQFEYKKTRKYKELKSLLKDKYYKMRWILQINTQLLNNNIGEQEFRNDIAFPQNVILIPTLNSDQTINFVKTILSKNDLEDDSSLKVINKFVKDIQLMKLKDRLFKILNILNNQLFNNVNNKLNIDDKINNQNHPLLSTLHVPFTSHIIST